MQQKIHRRSLLIGMGLAGLSACAGQADPAPTIPARPPASGATPATAARPTAPPAGAGGISYWEFPGASAVALAAAGPTAYLLLGMDDQLLVASAQGGAPFGELVQASSTPAFIMSIERPALLAAAEGAVSVGWLDKNDPAQTAIWLASSSDGGQTFGPGQRIASVPAVEAGMVRLGGAAGNPVLAWLEGPNLAFAAPDQAARIIDEQVCDCCQPHPLRAGGQLSVAFRNLEQAEDGRDIRDIFVIHSADGGRTFGAPVRVSDGHWYLDACPISGPALAVAGQRMYVSWMDGRNASDHSANDLWLASSSDGGQTFGPNRRLNPNPDQSNGQPAMVLGPAGELHIAWEARSAAERGIYYLRASAGGQDLGAPQQIARSGQTGHKRPEMPDLAVDSAGRVTLAWVDETGVQIASWLPS